MDTTGDDFDQLGRAVARVLRDAFGTAARTRQQGMADATSVARAAAEAAEELMMTARAEAESIRAQALVDAQLIVLKAHDELGRVGGMVAAERAKADTDVRAMLGSVRRAVAGLERDVHEGRGQTLERASNEAAMILRQARLHHRMTAKEVDRMIEAAASESARLRNAALEDAAAVAARVCAVIDMGELPPEVVDDPLPPNPDRRPNVHPNLRPVRPARAPGGRQRERTAG